MRKITLLLSILFVAGISLPAGADRETGKTDQPHKTCLVDWLSTWNDAVETVKESSKLVLLVIMDPALGARSKTLNEKLWSDGKIADYVSGNFAPLLISSDEPADHELAAQFKISRFPSILVIRASGEIIWRRIGFTTPEKLLKMLKKCVEVAGKEDELALNGKDLEKMYELARSYLEIKSSDKAKEILNEIRQEDSGQKNEFRIRAIFLLGGIAIGEKDYEKAAEFFEQVLELDPDDELGYADDIALQSALIDSYRGKYETAAGKIIKFIKKYPESQLLPEAYFHLGYCQYLLKDRDKAEETFKRLVKEFPDSSEGEQASKMIDFIKKLREAEKRRRAPKFG